MRNVNRIGKPLLAAMCLLGLWHGNFSQAIPVSAGNTTQTEQADLATQIPSSAATVTQPEDCIAGFPCLIPDTPLIAQALALYEGPFWEDGMDSETVCTGLLLTNTSDTMIEYARISVRQDDRDLTFELTYLPPGGDLLVLETNQATFSSAPVSRILCPRLTYAEFTCTDPRFYASTDGACNLIVTNLTDQPLDVVRIYYKHYYPQDNLFFGGITYSAVLTDLQPGESRRITPYHFLTDQSHIILCTTSQSDKTEDAFFASSVYTVFVFSPASLFFWRY